MPKYTLSMEPNGFNMAHFQSRLKILVVDPSPLTREGLAETLNAFGAEVVDVAYGFQCLRLLRERNFDVVIAGMRLPDMSGARLCKHIKGKNRRPGIKFMLEAGYLTIESLVEGMYSGADAVFCWPMPSDEFEEKLTHIIGRPFLQESAAA